MVPLVASLPLGMLGPLHLVTLHVDPIPKCFKNYAAHLVAELWYMHAAPIFAHASYTLSLQNKFYSHTWLQTSIVDLLRAQITEKNRFVNQDYYLMKRRDRYLKR
jgi:hypothetical protein